MLALHKGGVYETQVVLADKCVEPIAPTSNPNLQIYRKRSVMERTSSDGVPSKKQGSLGINHSL